MAAMTPGPQHPILGLRRHETTALCRALGLEWFDDPSNRDPRHLRNRVRHELLPRCSELARRDVVPVLARQADVFRAESELLDALARADVADPTDARALAAAPAAVGRRAVRRWLRESEPGGYPPSFAEVARVLSVAAGEIAGTELSGGRRVRRSKGRLSVDPPALANLPPVAHEEAGQVPHWAGPQVRDVLLSEHDVAERVRELGQKITADYADHPPLLVGVLKGAMLFMSDLCRTIELPVDVDFMAVSSYGSATRTSGVVRIVKDLDAELTGRHVLVVEDIIDSGLTLNYLRRYLQARQPASLEVCALLVKEGQQRTDLDLRYVGFTIPKDFVVGYGLDVDERYRNLRGVYTYRNGAT
jgi:hypoxanthine phosphoribosyltransferase